MFLRSLLLVAASLVPAVAAQGAELVVATVNNGHMIELQRQTRQFEQANPDVRVRWVTLEESLLRLRLSQDVATGAGAFDVVTLGLFETQVWGRQGWLRAITPPPDYDVDDLLPAIRGGLSVDGRLYAAPFYGEASWLMVRKDLLARAGIRLPERPTWAQVRAAAARLHDPQAGVYGICLRGKPGWGDNMALIMTMVNSFGGQLFDRNWRPQLQSRAWQDAVGLYVDLLQRYGPPGSAANSFNELLALFRQGRCALWVDATIAASFVTDPRQSKVADQVGFTQAPSAVTAQGATWLWAWGLAIPQASRQPEAAQRFVAWATSKAYIQGVADRLGWAAVPTGTRRSTYAQPAFVQAARFAAAERQAIDSVELVDGMLPSRPYRGVQFAAIPEYPAIGIAVGQQVAAALSGRVTVAQALRQAQQAADRAMREAGYYR